MSKEFVPVVNCSGSLYLKYPIKAMFNSGHSSVNICAIDKLSEYDSKTFPSWIQSLHCVKNVDEQLIELAKRVTVNYFLCPNATDEFEVEAYYGEVFREEEEEQEKKRLLFNKPDLHSLVVGFGIGCMLFFIDLAVRLILG